ncbi:hypothetical protein CC86DRAFT_380589 [Ophiobolus disseminans]|uniref:Uncharacterized protein n=1 Tax=Ophiobolus disseminans TaxID=1469910 RepID=A0A6A7A7N3_9PLEO|nr:hypothetical protein CC86DRAFT_380589 [Ophiobolus disseminans]
MSDKDLNAMISYSLSPGPSRKAREELAALILNDITRHPTIGVLDDEAREVNLARTAEQAQRQTLRTDTKNVSSPNRKGLGDRAARPAMKRVVSDSEDEDDPPILQRKSRSRRAQNEQTPTAPIVSIINFRREKTMLGEGIVGRVNGENTVRFARLSDFVLFMPDGTQSGSWQQLKILPPATIRDIQISFYQDNQSDGPRFSKFQWMVADPPTHLDRGYRVSRCTIGRKTQDCRYDQAQGTIFRTCDNCITTKRLCARLVRVGGETKWGIPPLPIARRVNIK